MKNKNLELRTVNLKDSVGKITSQGFHTAFIGRLIAYYLGDLLSEQVFQSPYIYEFANYAMDVTSAYVGARIGWFAGANNVVNKLFLNIIKKGEN